jgi:hypothetical protein
MNNDPVKSSFDIELEKYDSLGPSKEKDDFNHAYITYLNEIIGRLKNDIESLKKAIMQ